MFELSHTNDKNLIRLKISKACWCGREGGCFVFVCLVVLFGLFGVCCCCFIVIAKLKV